MRTFNNVSIIVFSLLQFWGTGAFEFTVNQFKHAKIIKKEDLPGFKKSSTVSVLYYFQKDNPRHRGFYFEYDKSAEYLGLYNLELGVVDCRDPGNADVDKCSQDNSPSLVFTYSHGNELLPLEIETMFDVNSMMSNILQLVLLRDVPILQSEKEIESFANKHKGSSDLVFSFQKAIGTYEHRIFMEVAYAFHHKFKFAISTSLKAVEGLPSAPDSSVDAKIWMMKCSEVVDDSDCFTIVYDEKMDLSSLANFMRRLDLPAQFDIPGNGTSHPFSPDLGLHLVYLFYRRTTEDSVREMMYIVGNQFHGKAAFISVDIEHASADKLEVEFPMVTPSVAVQFKSQGPLAVMTDAWSIDTAFEFFANKLHEYNRLNDVGMVSSDEANEGEESNESFPGDVEQRDRYSEDVETEDDHVAEAVQRARRVKMDLGLATGLTDQTFSSTIEERDIVFILFYFPFDHRSLAFLRAYGEAARKFENQTDRPYSYVNCHDWTDVCAKEKITQYPTLKIYQHGKFLKDFDGMLSIEDVITAYQLLKQEKPVSLLEKTDIEHFLNGLLPDGTNISGNVFVVGLFAAAQSKGVQTYQEVAKKLGDKLTFGINSNGNGKDFMKIYGCSDLPCIVILKKTDIVQPYVAYKGDVSSVEALTTFIEQSFTPTFAELTPSLFPRLYKQNRPFVISFVDGTQTSREMLKPVQSLVTSGSFPDLIFCSLESGDINSFGRQILQTYHNSTSSSVPALSYAHLRKGKVYNYMDKSFSREHIEAWLQDIQSESSDTQAQFMLKEGRFKPRIQGYHFLEFIREDEASKKKTKQEKKEDPDVLAANIHGLGFDREGNEVEGAGGGEEAPREEVLVDDSEIRKELIDLQKSRLYHHAEGKHKPPHKKHPADQSESSNIRPTGEDQGPNIPATQDTTSIPAGSTTPPPKKSIIHDDL